MTSEKSSTWDVQRLAALSDGIFAVAMTLLAYNVHVPSAPLSERQLGVELGRMLGEALSLLMSFAVAAMFWMSHFRWKPTMAQVFWTSGFGAPLVSRLVNALRSKRTPV
jgi:uncharacterized membrane protein